MLLADIMAFKLGLDGVLVGKLHNHYAQSYVVAAVIWSLFLIFALLALAMRRANSTLADNIAAREQAQTERDRLEHTLRMVGACNQLLVRAQSDEELRLGICSIIAEAGDYALVWVALVDEEGGLRPAAHAGREAQRLWPLLQAQMSKDNPAAASALQCTAARTGIMCSTCNVAAQARCAPVIKALGAAGVPACTSLPLRHDGRLIGTLMLHSDCAEEMSAPVLETLTELADDLAFGLEAHRDRRALRASQERLHLALDAAGMTTWEWDLETDQLRLGDNAEKLLDLAGLNGSSGDIRRHILDADRAAFAAAARNSVQHGKDFSSEFRLVHSGGRRAWIEAMGRPMRDGAGVVKRLGGVARDITQRRRADDAMRLRQRAMEASGEGITLHEVKNKGLDAIWVNPAFDSITAGYTSSSISGRKGLKLIARCHRKKAITTYLWAMRQGSEAKALLRCVRKDGSEFWGDASIAPVRNEEGQISHALIMLRDVSERIRQDEQLRQHATHDALTGLANHALFVDRLTQALIHEQRHGRTAAVLALDLDRFKLVNDSLGHHGGDELLRIVAALLGATVRPGDTVARFSGNEFAILLSDVADEEDLTAIASHLLARISDPVELAGQTLSLSASMGVSVYPRDGSDAETLLRNADSAMRRSKAQGGNCFTFYTPEMNIRALERLQLEAGLRRALSANEFVLHYQPQMCLRSGRITGVEALVRWQHPERGLLGPNEFIPVAEESDLIRHIGNWVLNTAVQQAAAWQHTGRKPVRMAVNLSARQLAGPDLLTRVKSVLEQTGLDPALLELELTETAVMRNPDEAQATLRALRELGVHLAMDDFGTGYSSLSHLRRFPFNVLKIDRAFVNGIVSDSEDALLVRSIVSMGAAMGLEVIAEGVETPEQVCALSDVGCAMVQGYWLSRPMEQQALAAWLEQQGLGHGSAKPLPWQQQSANSEHGLQLVPDSDAA